MLPNATVDIQKCFKFLKETPEANANLLGQFLCDVIRLPDIKDSTALLVQLFAHKNAAQMHDLSLETAFDLLRTKGPVGTYAMLGAFDIYRKIENKPVREQLETFWNAIAAASAISWEVLTQNPSAKNDAKKPVMNAVTALETSRSKLQLSDPRTWDGLNTLLENVTVKAYITRSATELTASSTKTAASPSL